MSVESSLRKIMEMPDSNGKLMKLMLLGTKIGCFNKQPIIDEIHRLRDLGYGINTQEVTP